MYDKDRYEESLWFPRVVLLTTSASRIEVPTVGYQMDNAMCYNLNIPHLWEI